MSKDIIYREDAIKVIKDNSFAPGVDYLEINGYGAIDDIRALPSADRPQGEWIFRREFVEDKPFTGYRCSNCNYWKSMGAWNYCPNCGSRMKGADDE